MTLRAAIEWSYELLAEETRRAFRQLGMFRRSWTLEAADVVVGPVSRIHSRLPLLVFLIWSNEHYMRQGALDVVESNLNEAHRLAADLEIPYMTHPSRPWILVSLGEALRVPGGHIGRPGMVGPAGVLGPPEVHDQAEEPDYEGRGEEGCGIGRERLEDLT